MIDRTTIDRIMAAADIVDVVKEFVTLRKSGVNYKGLCPFHDERTPSFTVSPSKQYYKCFSCGKGGNVITFLKEHEQLTYPEALKWLAKKYGIEVRERELTDDQKAAASERESMFVVNEFARDFFVKTLHETVDGMAVGMTYFRGRGLRDDTIRKFQLGFSPDEREAFSTAARTKGLEAKFLTATGLSIEREGGRLLDRYAGRVIFPVHNIGGRVVAFGGRSLLSKEEQKRRAVGKYVNSPESNIYSKKRELYGLYQARHAIAKHDRVYLVEGYLDVISMSQSGIENVVASSGTSLTNEQVRLIHRFTNNVTVLYDGDAAGIHAAMRGIDMLLAEGLNIQVLLLPDGEDPDSFAQSHTPEELRKYIADNSTDFISFKTERLLADAKGDPRRRAQLIHEVVDSIAVIPDNIVRQMYVHEFAGRMGIDESTIVNEITISRKRIRDAQREEAAREEARQHRESVQQGGGQQVGGQTVATTAGTTPVDSPAISSAPYSDSPPIDEPPIFDDEGNLINGPVQGGQQTTAVLDEGRYSQKTKARKLLEGCERQLVEAIVRYGGLPIILQPEKVERKFAADFSEEAKAKAEEEKLKKRRVIVEAPESPLVAPYVYETLEADGVELKDPLHQAILIEAANLADEAYAERRKALEQGVAHEDAPPFFDAINYFRMHSNPAIVQKTEELADDRYLLSTSQAMMYTPDEKRLVEMIPRLINDYKHATIGIEREQLLKQVRMPEVLGNESELLRVMQRLQELSALEVLFAKELGGRVINK